MSAGRWRYVNRMYSFCTECGQQYLIKNYPIAADVPYLGGPDKANVLRMTDFETVEEHNAWHDARQAR